MSPEIWRAGVDFLVDLHLVGRDDATAEQDGPWEQVSRQAETMARHLGPFARDRLDGLVRRQREAVAGVPVGWGHGDLWLQNLLAERGRLIGVVDWDWASPTSLPLLDVLELWAFAHFRAPAEPGPRALYLRARLPRIREDRHVRHYAEAVGLELSEQLLRAAVVAYWLDRVSRDLRPFAGRAANRRWVTANLHRPLAALCDREPGT